MRTKGINFSYAYSRGSKAERIEKTWNLGQQIFDNVVEIFDKQTTLPKDQKSVPISSLRDFVRKNLPEMLKFSIKKNSARDSKKCDGCLTSHYNSKGASYYSMKISAQNNRLYVDQIPIFMHEIIHLLDRANQPQYQAVESQLHKKGLSGNFFKFYEDVFYTKKNYSAGKTKRKTKKFLKDMPIENQLLALRLFKLNMETETRAYLCSNNVGRMLGWNNNKIFLNQLVYQNYNFERNIELVDKMRADLIIKERNKIKKAHKK